MAGNLHRRTEDRSQTILLAHLRVGGDAARRPVKVRNLSTQGMMGEGAFQLHNGTRLTVDLPQQGTVAGTVVWVQEPRFGVAFDEAVDPSFA